MASDAPTGVSEAQVRAFRSRRGHLAGPGAVDAVAAARAVVGIQAQVEGPAYWAISMRSASRPTAAVLKAAWQTDRTLVRTWAQRDTLHMFGVEDWSWFGAAVQSWSQTGRATVRAPDEVLAEARARFRAAAATRTDVLDLVTDTMRREMAERVGEEQAERYASGRIPWQLARLGEVCLGPKRGSEQSYVHRDLWLPEAPGFERDPTEAAIALTRRYLGVHGPATAKDVAHFFGARAPLARAWLEALTDHTTAVQCEGRDLVALSTDLEDLCREPEPADARLVAGYDTLLMAHADKSWTTPSRRSAPDLEAIGGGGGDRGAPGAHRGHLVAQGAKVRGHRDGGAAVGLVGRRRAGRRARCRAPGGASRGGGGHGRHGLTRRLVPG